MCTIHQSSSLVYDMFTISGAASRSAGLQQPEDQDDLALYSELRHHVDEPKLLQLYLQSKTRQELANRTQSEGKTLEHLLHIE
ncbi:hypothetical protein PR003_g26011 [Phytophthora rubi]|uniref:Uncharacterized protein n=1 Tax=Phytophthora rubi TaxID=129364 RepID=A0A6A3I8X2_9STRA|nr:hypothetical protein PR002_g24409 [Phytophthora rubi]KAE8979834.1 hypothetical protein PR001_g24441 [Phytophthora rubi]KAE9287608.1 hypothetical protein PR003_g26011 [Phytophthora rubi]